MSDPLGPELTLDEYQRRAAETDIEVDGKDPIVPLLGLVVAFLAAMVSIRWMVSYLSRHDLSIFGWYRIGVALIVLGLLASHTI